MNRKLVILFLISFLLLGCATKERKPFTAKENQEWLQPILKPGYVMWVNDGENGYRFVLIEATNDGLVGENILIPYGDVKYISWKTPKQTEAHCSKNQDECEAYWYLGSILIWLPLLL
ncbi:hypothetical protein ACWXWU_20725 [Shewanella sp. A14]